MRKAKKIKVKDFVNQYLNESEDLLYTNNQIVEDLNKVSFDLENYEIGLINDLKPSYMLDGLGIHFLSVKNGELIFVGCQAGGDWQDPVYFILYYDNKNKLRAYIPKEGNTYNLKHKEAGSEDDSDLQPRVFNLDLIIKDIKSRIEIV